MHFSKHDILALVGIASVMGLSAAVFVNAGQVGVFGFIAVIALLLIGLSIESRRRNLGYLANTHAQLATLLSRSEQDYRQLEALFTLYKLLPLRAPLPPMRGWAICPDFAVFILQTIREVRPLLVMELGSGVSTIIASYALEAAGRGRVVSVEHEAAFAEQTARRLEQHGMNDIATVIHASLKKVTVGDRAFMWYSIDALPNTGTIDLLIVDGPPGHIQEFSRYPALPLLRERLSPQATIVLDDADRVDEKRILEMWQAEMPGLKLEKFSTEKGTAMLKTPSPRPSGDPR
ncbi:MAG: class I SAM-dependent methyltransferase [Thermodesulfovibrionales bacterium]